MKKSLLVILLILFSKIVSAQCSGTPVGGTTYSSAASPCICIPFFLGVTGSSYTNAIDFSCQWELSTVSVSGPFASIVGAINPTSDYNFSSLSTNYFRRKIICLSSQDSAYSTVLTLTSYNCTCMPSFNIGTSTGFYIDRVQQLGNSFDVTTGPSLNPPFYFNNCLNNVDSVMRGGSYFFKIYTGSNTGIHKIATWVDWDQSGVFGNLPYEMLEWDTISGGLNNYLYFQYWVPMSATLGYTKLRIRDMGNASLNTPDPCSSVGPDYDYGETEDYIINVAPYSCTAGTTPGTIFLDTIYGTHFCLSDTGGVGNIIQWDISDNPFFSNILASFPAGNNCFINSWNIPFLYARAIYQNTLCPTAFSNVVTVAFNQIAGNVFIDMNGNSIYDAGDIHPSQLFIESFDGSNYYYTQTDTTGNYSQVVGTGTFSTTVLPYYNYNVTPASVVFTLSSFGNIDTANFILTPINNNVDLAIYSGPITQSKQGHVADIYIGIANYGDYINPIVKYVLDTSILLSGTYPPYDSIIGDTLIWNLPTMIPYHCFNILILGNYSSSTPIGDPVNYFSSVEPIGATDINPLDNFSLYSDTMVSSYDPNEKISLIGNVMYENQIQQGEYIPYLIRFQNTGTAAATDIRLRDTLSANLDLSSIQVMNASAAYDFHMVNNAAEFFFPNIQLPDSGANEPASHGFIAYRIKPLSSVSYGDEILNRCSIYFDYNDPVLTNTEMVFVCDSLQSNTSQTICEGDSILIGSNWQLQSGVYTTELNSQSGCDSIATVTLNVVSINNGVTVSGNIAVAQQSGMTYQWINCDNLQPVSGATNQQFTPNTSGNYAVIISSNTGCMKQSACTFIAATGIASVDFQNAFQLIPNPANDFVKIQLNGNEKNNSLKISDVTGRMLSEIPINKNEITLNTSNFNEGIYLVQLLQNEKIISTKRLVIVR